MKRASPFFLLLLLAGAGSAQHDQPLRAVKLAPRPLSEAERQAVVFAAEYLTRGPEAFWDRLARRSALRRLGREAALAEIEVRAGRPQGARWELSTRAARAAGTSAVFTVELPSGVDETLTLDLVREGTGWALAGLAIAAEPAAWRAAAPAPEEEPASEEEPAPSRPWLPWTSIVAAAVLGLGAYILRQRRLAALLLAGGAVMVLVIGISGRLTRGDGDGEPKPAEETASGPARLAELLPLRRALASAEGEVPAAAPKETRLPGTAGDVARLWWTQHLLSRMDLQEAERILGVYPSPAGIPMVELLRARLGFLRLEEVSTALAYERALDAGAPHEALLLESAQAMLLLGFYDHARKFLDQLARMGARRADVYYARAELAVLDNEVLASTQSFVTAWRLEPIHRAAMFSEPLLTALLDDPALRKLVSLDQPAEPMALCERVSQRAIELPAGLTAKLAGEWLSIRGDAVELSVPGGCDLAPAGTERIQAGQLAKAREAEALAGLAELEAAVHSVGATAQPALRRKVHEASRALAVRQRWEELLALTDNVNAGVQLYPSEVVRLRAAALTRPGRRHDARNLLVELAKGDVSERRRDPATLYQLAELLSEAGEYDAAMKLVAKANSQLPFEAGDDRLRQLQMEKRLTGAFRLHETRHFILHYPPGRDEAYIQKAADILEQERLRLQAYIPPLGPANPNKKIEVLLFPFEDFRLGYSPALDVLGLYDGKIRLPLGDVRRFAPFVVSLMSHELAHAMIAERTLDRAPRWFHEGLAQHVQMVQDVVNPMPGYALKKSLISFPLLEPAINSYSPVLVTIGYDEAAWTLHYIETRYGKAGIHRLLDAFRDAQTTEEALQSALGRSQEQFDGELWRWCLEDGPAAWKVDVVTYDPEPKGYR